MGSNKFEFGDYIEFEIEKRFGIIPLNRLHRSNLPEEDLFLEQ